ncbi:hypothetical protein HELRODRAFT_161690 [Helobdella robusta]|uniref:Uncharacterized protein n=1 Tax=Helobdella robusta TaxID=6412 RepID=T1ERS7_HELRO|nr:hypothetical protein HELRODRAFT_161690 [Helobdella robusta]ESO02422.1 hypothetical protein HELRODRAFT_161690 [Helobdella robusta]
MASASAKQTAEGSKVLSWREKRIMNAKPAVNLVLSSVSEIIKRSTNDSFRRACFDLMKVDNRLDFEVALRHHMIKMIKMRHGLDLESDNDTEKQKSICDQSTTCTMAPEMNNSKDISREKVKVKREKPNITEVIEISDNDDDEDNENDDDADDLRFF